jgi:hypothetical protein
MFKTIVALVVVAALISTRFSVKVGDFSMNGTVFRIQDGLSHSYLSSSSPGTVSYRTAESGDYGSAWWWRCQGNEDFAGF